VVYNGLCSKQIRILREGDNFKDSGDNFEAVGKFFVLNLAEVKFV